jgi:hypothetical protein
MLSNSESESDEEFLSGIRLIDRCSDSSDDDSDHIDDIAYESYDDGSDNLTIPDPVDRDLWIEQWDIRVEEGQLSHGHSNECSTSGENSDIEVIMYHDSGDESIISTSDSSNEDIPGVQYHSASSESYISEDFLDVYDEIYESYDDDEADCWEDSVSFGAQHNLNVGSVEQPWKSI